jgi:2-methylcitrate dehydratase PrpD
MAYCLAVAVACGRLTPDDFSPAPAGDERIVDLIAKVRHHDDAKSLTVTLSNGEKISEPILPVIDLHGWDQVVTKFDQCTGEQLTKPQRSAIVDMVAQLEKLSSVRSLTEALQPRSK